MMIWLPFENFEECARSMDSRTLTIQRFDAWRLLHMLQHGVPAGMGQNATLRMWRDYPTWVAAYGMAICLEWEKTSDRPSELTQLFRDYLDVIDVTEDYPRWLGDSMLHMSHRSNMIKLDPDRYMKLWPGVIEGMPLMWPKEEGDDDE